MNLNEHEMQESVFSLCLEALKRMHEERILTKNITNVHLYKDPHILLYPYDKVFEVLDNNDSVSIILSNFFLKKTHPFLKYFIFLQR